MASGRGGSIGIGKETTFGTAVAPTAFFNGTESITEERGRLRESINFGTRSRQPADAGRLRIRGAISGIHARPGNLGHLLRAALGAPDTTGSGPYVHKFEPALTKFSAAAALPPYSVTVKRNPTGGIIHRYDGGQLTQLTLRQPVDDALVVDTDWVFKGVTPDVGDTTLALETAGRFRFQHLAITRGGAGVTNVESVTIGINNAIDPGETLNASNTISVTDFGDSVITVDMTLQFADDADYEDFVANTTRAWVFTWTSSPSILKITVPKLNIESWSAPISAPGRMTVSCRGVAEYDGSATNELEVELTNATTSY